MGRGNLAAKNFYISWPQNVEMGSDCLFENDVTIKIDHAYCERVLVKLGNNVFVGQGAEFNISNYLEIGNDTLIAAGCRIIDHDHGLSPHTLIRKQSGDSQPIIIGDDCWLGANVIILKGCKIGNGAVIAAGSVLTKSVPPMEIWAGIPARKISSRNVRATA
jgi:acetyltransferase-like isoleucine patch superfamily enzyme